MCISSFFDGTFFGGLKRKKHPYAQNSWAPRSQVTFETQDKCVLTKGPSQQFFNTKRHPVASLLTSPACWVLVQVPCGRFTIVGPPFGSPKKNNEERWVGYPRPSDSPWETVGLVQDLQWSGPVSNKLILNVFCYCCFFLSLTCIIIIIIIITIILGKASRSPWQVDKRFLIETVKL